MEKTVKKYLLVLFAIGLVISACTPKEAAAPLIGTWKLIAYGPVDSPSPAVTAVEATLTFGADGKLTGSGGCNSLSGDYEGKGEQITFGPITSTLMGCPDPQMAQEGIVHQVLTGTANFKIEGNTLTITNNDMVLVFERVAGE